MRTDLRCIRCGATYDSGRDYFGCPACAPVAPANLELAGHSPCVSQTPGERGMWRWAEALPVPADQAITLGEGGTPLLELSRLGEAIGLPNLLAKNEAQNPTWSFKDRLASAAVSWAKANGRAGIAVSSSGNAGAAAAAYAARAGLPCIIFTTRAFPGSMQRFMRSYGAMVVAAPTGPDRWTLNRAVAGEWGWLPLSNVADPPVGSHPAGIEGHKTIAFEIAADLKWQPPDAIVIPVAYGDAMAGIYRGFRELLAAGLITRLPRLMGIEAYPSLSRALAENAASPATVEATGSKAFSVATPRGTYQALRAIRETNGTAIAIPDEETMRAHETLRRQDGLFVEFSSAMPLAGATRLRERGELNAGDRVVLLITSSGLKDAEMTTGDGDLPLVQPDLKSLAGVLKEHYGFLA